jgi:hypothetical protein
VHFAAAQPLQRTHRPVFNWPAGPGPCCIAFAKYDPSRSALVTIDFYHPYAAIRGEERASPDESAAPRRRRPRQRNHTVSRHSSPIDQRPFQPKSKLESQTSLVSQYGDVAIQEVAEALHHLKAQSEESDPRPTKLSDAA